MMLPNLFRAWKSMFFIGWYWVRGYKTLVSPEIQEARLGTCEECELFLSVSRQCAVCSCFVDAKTHLASEQCPKNRWNRVKVLSKHDKSNT